MTSALTGDGLDRLKARLAAAMPKGPWLYPEDQIADAPLRALAAEITREKLFERLHDELPYQTTVETELWKDQPDGSARVEQTIYVTRDSHKKIVIGEGGRTIKAIGSAARKEIAEAHEAPVHLFLFVKVRANWLDDPERYRAMGLEFPKKYESPTGMTRNIFCPTRAGVSAESGLGTFRDKTGEGIWARFDPMKLASRRLRARPRNRARLL